MGKQIVIVGPAFPLRGGGMSTFNERLAKAFEEEGHEVCILTFKLQYPKILFPGKTQLAIGENPPNLNIDVMMNSINPLNWLRVGRKYRKLKPDVMIFRYWMPFMAPCFGMIARIVNKNKHTRCYAITDNVIPHEKRMGDKILTSYFLKPIQGFIAMSRSVLNDLSIFDKVKPRKYIAHPLYDNYGPPVAKETARNELDLDPKGNYLLFFGFIRAYKGLDLLLRSLSKVDHARLNLKLIIAGEFYADQKYYLDLIKELKLEEAVSLHTDFIPNHRVPLYFSAADMVAQTYISATQSGVTQVAYYYKLPMLVTNVGGLAELVPHKKVGYVCDKNEQEIADAITDFYTQDRMKEMVKEIEQERTKYSWSNLVSELLALS